MSLLKYTQTFMWTEHGQAESPYLNDLLQVPPGLLQGLHGEPGVRVGHHLVALDLLVQLSQLVEVGLS